MPRSKLLEVAAVPWSYFPPELNKREDLRFDWGVGAQLRNIFASHFLRAQRDPSSPREMLLRGKLGKTTSELIVKERDHWHRSLGRAMPDGLEEWLERARNADLLQARAESGAEDPAKARQAMQALLKWRTSDAISVLMTNAIAAPRAADLTYQMGLCMHERGVRAEALAALSARAGTELPDERQRAREAWEAASGWWEALLKEFPNDLSAPMARRLLGESLARLGRADEARKAWSATGPPSNDLEQLGDLWLARRK
jgi:tetratricopeptide (TPR) repeat protein